MKIIFTILILIFVDEGFARDIDATSEIRSAFQFYKNDTNNYIQNINEAADFIRKWRQKRLSEIFDQKLTSLEEKLTLSNQNLVDEYNKFKKDKGFDILNDALLLRLAHLYFEGASLSFNKKMKEHQSAMNMYLAGRTKNKPMLPVPEYSNTISYAKKILMDFPDSPLADRAYYLIGYSYDEMGLFDKAKFAFERLATLYPYSLYAEESMWRIAEEEFNNRAYDTAKFYYAKLAATTGNYKIKSIYKLGATYFATKEYNKSFKILKSLINFLDDRSTVSQEDASLYDEALSYMGVLKTHGVDLDLEPKHLLRAYQLLGETYKKRYDERSMRRVYEEAIARFPYSSFTPTFYSEIIESYESDGQLAQANKMRDEFITLVTKNSDWWDKNERMKEAYFKAEDQMEEHLLKSARYFAEYGVQSKSQKYMDLAKDRYESFIKNYNYSPYIATALMELSDLNYITKNYARAAELYTKILSHETSAYTVEKALYSYVWSKAKLVGYQPNYEDDFIITNDSQKNSKINLKEQGFIDATDLYLSNVSTGVHRQTLLIQLAEIYSKTGDLKRAEDALLKLVADRSNSSLLTMRALRVLESIYNLRGEWQKITEVRELASTLRFKTSFYKIDKMIANQIKGTDLDGIFELEGQGQYDQAIARYQSYMVTYPKTNLKTFLNFKIALLYHEAHNYTKSQEYLNKLVKSPFAVEVLYVTAQNFIGLAQFEKACEYFEKFLKIKKSHPWQEEAVTTAFLLRRDLNQPAKAFDLLNQFWLQHKKSYQLFNLLETGFEIGKYKFVEDLANRIDKKDINSWLYAHSLAARSLWKQNKFSELGKKCADITQESKTAYYKLAKSWCQYYKIKLQIADGANLNNLQKDLNVLRSLNITEVLVKALSDVALKLNDPKEAMIISQEAWKYAREIPYTDVGELAQKVFIKTTGQIPIHLGWLINWRLPLVTISNLEAPENKNIPWESIKSSCEGYRIDICVKGLESVYKTEPTIDTLKNLIYGYLKIGDDKKALEYFDQFGIKDNWGAESVHLAYILGVQSRVPEKNRIIKNSNQTDSYIAMAEFVLGNNKFLDAQKYFVKAIEDNPQDPLPYGLLSRAFFQNGFYRLAVKTLEEGIINTSDMGGLFALRAQIESALRRYARLGYAEDSFDWNYLTASGIGFIALKNKDEVWLKKVKDSLSGYKFWNDIFDKTVSVYNRGESKSSTYSSNAQMAWLEYVSKAKNLDTSSQEQLSQVINYGYFNPMYAKIINLSRQRGVAGEKRD